MDKIEELNFIEKMHSGLKVNDYLKGLFAERLVGPIDFFSLATYCQQRTKTNIPPLKTFRRFERLWVVLKYFIFSMNQSKGPIAECGVLRGFTSLAITILQNEMKKESLENIWMIDSYEGLSAPIEEDETNHKKGHFATPLEEVEILFKGSTNCQFAKGWIPEVFEKLPETKWSFVHIDVDLYEPIYESLNYFFPRMSENGVIINDDFGSPLFPGARKSWDKFFSEKNRKYAILDTGQAIFINN